MECISCKVGLKRSKTIREYAGIDVKNVDCMRCPRCGEEYFTGEQQRKLESLAKELGVFGAPRLKRKLGRSGSNIIVRIPRDIAHELGLDAGDSVSLWKEGKRIVISPA